MQQEGYDRLSKDAQKSLDDTLKYVEGNAAAQEQVVSYMLQRLENNYDKAYSVIDARIKQTGTVIGKTAEKQIKDLNGTLTPLQAWADLVQQNEGTLSEFLTKWETVVDNISTKPIRFMTEGAQEALENLGLLTKAMREYRSAYEEMVGGLEANGQQKTSYTDADDKKKAEQAAGGETAAQAKARRATLTKMFDYAKSRSVATASDFTSHRNDELWNYLYNLTGKNTTATEMAHLAQYLRELGADLEGVPYKSKVTKESDLSMDARNKILAAMKQYGFGTNQGAMAYINNRNIKMATSGQAATKAGDPLWTYFYKTTGRDLSEYEMLHIGKAYTNVKDLPTESSFKNNSKAALTKEQKEAILTALQYNGFDLKDYILSIYGTGGLAPEQITNAISPVKTGTTTTTNQARQETSNASATNLSLKEHALKILGKTPTDADYVKLAKDYGVSGITATTTQLTQKQKDELLSKILASGYSTANKKGYAKGTKSIPYTGSHWTHSGELLVRKDGAYLTPLSKGDGVIPANLTENLMKWGAIDPSAFLMKMGKVPTANNTSNTTYNNSYDSLLTVYGDVDKEALPELQEILKKACDYTNKYNAREARKLGRK